MASPPTSITTVNGRRCTRVRRTSTLLASENVTSRPRPARETASTDAQPQTSTSPAELTSSTAAAPGTQPTAEPSSAAPLPSTESALPVPVAPSSSLSSPSVSPPSSVVAVAPSTTAAPVESAASSALQPASSAAQSTLASAAQSAVSSAAQLPFSSAAQSVISSTAAAPSISPSAAQSIVPSSTVPTSSAQSGRSDTLTPVVTVVSSSSTFTIAQPTATTAASDSSGLIGQNSQSDGSTHSSSGHKSDGSGHHSSGLSPGAIAGIVIGVLIGIGLIAFLIWYCLKRRKEREEGLDEKNLRDAPYSGSQPRPLSALAAKWAAFKAGVATKAGLTPHDSDAVAARRTPESPAFEPANSRSSYSSDGSARHLRSNSAPAPPPASGFLGLKDRLKQKVGLDRARGRASTASSIPSFYSPSPSDLEDLPESLNPFRDPEPLQYHITNPDAPTLSPPIKSAKSGFLMAEVLGEQRTPLTPGSARWRQPTPEFAFPASRRNSENPFLDPPRQGQRNSTGSSTYPAPRRNSLSAPPLARVASHARTQSSATNPMTEARSSWYSNDSGYNSPHHPSANIQPLRPAKNPFTDRYATEVEKPDDAASIYLLPSSRQASVDSGGPPGPIALPSSSKIALTPTKDPLPTTSTARSSWLSPNDSPASSYLALRTRHSRASSRSSSRRRTAMSRATRGKSDPFDLDRPEVFAAASNYGEDVPGLPQRSSNGSDWWKGIVDEGTGGQTGSQGPLGRTAPYAYGMAR